MHQVNLILIISLFFYYFENTQFIASIYKIMDNFKTIIGAKDHKFPYSWCYV